MKILIATGIYPPELGGPAEYAKNLGEIWQAEGHMLYLHVFSYWKFLPSGIRHVAYFFSLLPDMIRSDFVLALDTLSCALPAVLAAKLFGKKIILRTGGDFLWEAYVERTGDLVLMKNFYKTRMDRLNQKEKLTMSLIGFVLRNVDSMIWSTQWQKDIFMQPYGLEKQTHTIVENYYGPRLPSQTAQEKNFVAATRLLRWKNIKRLKKVFSLKPVIDAGALLDMKPAPHAEFLDKIARSYSLIIPSLGDISPNTILDAIRFNKPFIVTQETGLYDRIKDIALFVDPENEKDIEEKIIWLSDPGNYEIQKKKVESFHFVHTWEDIAKEYMDVLNRIQK